MTADDPQLVADLAALREEYQRSPLRRSELDVDPLSQFGRWFEEWLALDPFDANAMVLATVNAEGRPTARFVLLKGFGPSGFSFFTNYHSAKAGDAVARPVAALCFGWLPVARQVRVEGRVERVEEAESDAYWAARPRGSQLGAWASDQSHVVPDRAHLDERLRQVTERFEGRPVDRPPHWGGFRVVPDRYEFWQGRADRMHDRFRYRRPHAGPGGGWVIERLAP